MGRKKKYSDAATVRVVNIWHGMKARCYNPKNPSYRYYGGRGIGICDRWLVDVEAFVADVGLPPTDLHSIDRYPDNNGNYEPGNCRWATPAQQAANTSRTPKVKYLGKIMPAREWAALVGLDGDFASRMAIAGFTATKIMKAAADEQACREVEEKRRAMQKPRGKSPLFGRKFKVIKCEVCGHKRREWQGQTTTCPREGWHPNSCELGKWDPVAGDYVWIES